VTALENAGHRLGTGATAVVAGLAAWPSKAESGDRKAGRWVVLLGGGWLTEQLVARTHLLGLVLAAGFLVGAWLKGAVPEPAAAVTDEGAQNAATVEFVLAVIGDRQGVHLVELLPAIQAHADHWRGCDKTFLRRALVETVGLPVRKKLRVGTETGIPGVHRDDAAATLARLTTPPAVATPSDAPSEDVDAGRSTRRGAV
jgi:hypothetical protein